MLALPIPKGLSYEGKMALTVFVFTGTIFALQPVPLPFAGLMVFVILIALGVSDSDKAFSTLSRPIIILILGSLFLAEALRKHGLTRRMALYTVVASKGKITRLLLGLMCVASFLSMWMENTATAAVLIPVALTISNQVKDKKKSKELLVLLVLGIAYAASLGGMATITGSASNAVASEFLSEIREWAFLDWMKYGLLALFMVFPITFLLLIRSIPISINYINIERAKKEIDNLGELQIMEIEILLVLGITIVLWIGGPTLEVLFGLPKTFLSPSVVGIISVSYLAIRGIIEWEDVRGVSWGMFFAISAGLSLGEALKDTGATTWLTSFIAPIINTSPFIISLILMVISSALLTNVVNNATVAAILVPIMIEISQGNPDFNAISLVLPLTMATTFGYSLPSASGRMALISSTGYVNRGEMFKYGIIMTFASSLILVTLFYILTWLNFV
jgi:sodium-dependent dicarboxylate transporter 2/3/5